MTEELLEAGVIKADGPHAELRHWRFHHGANDVIWLLLDKADTDTNTFDQHVFEELAQALDTIEPQLKSGKARALAIRSLKDNGFATGADIRMLADFGDEAVARERLAAAHALLDRIEKLDAPTIAVLHGHCLGGGLELALACKFRIARSDTTFGLPEVRIGLHPGLGGTARMVERIAPTEALKLMLTGKSIGAKRARSLGLIDAVVEERHIAKAVAMAADRKLPRRSAGEAKIGLMSLAPSRAVIANRAQAETEKRTRREQMPAPFALIDLWREHGDSKTKMLAAERESFIKLLATPASRNLIRVFFLREKMKSLGKERDSGIRHVHVIGAGAMGGDIAAWCALRGLTVTIEDADSKSLADAYQRAAELFDDEAEDTERKKAYDRLIPDFKSAGVRHADLVIEAVPEDADIKRQVYQRVEPQMKSDALLTTNTSSLQLGRLRAGVQRPQRFLGLHFFNPVRKMQLVEVVEHDAAGAAALTRARAFVAQIDRLPAPVQSAPGFLVNRALMPYMLEALVMLDEGVAAETVDAAAIGFGMPVGPIELADRVGLDICVSVAEVLRRELEQPMPETPDWLRGKVERGELGLKSGRGLYEWNAGKPKKKTQPADAGDLTDRLMLPMLNACVACLREHVVDDEDVLDAAMIFATGFAPFRGGPIHYARERGINDIIDRLNALEQQHGPRFAADAGWRKLG